MWDSTSISVLLRTAPDLVDAVLAKRLRYFRATDGCLHGSWECDALRTLRPAVIELGVADLLQWVFCDLCSPMPPDPELSAWVQAADMIAETNDQLDRAGARNILPTGDLEQAFRVHCWATWELADPPDEMAVLVEKTLDRSWAFVRSLRAVRARQRKPSRQASRQWLASIGSNRYEPRWRLCTVHLRPDGPPDDYVLVHGVPVPHARGVVAFVCHPGEQVPGAEDHDSFQVDPARLRAAVRHWLPWRPDSWPVLRPISA